LNSSPINPNLSIQHLNAYFSLSVFAFLGDAFFCVKAWLQTARQNCGQNFCFAKATCGVRIYLCGSLVCLNLACVGGAVEESELNRTLGECCV
jgi:hypothetical protein